MHPDTLNLVGHGEYGNANSSGAPLLNALVFPSQRMSPDSPIFLRWSLSTFLRPSVKDLLAAEPSTMPGISQVLNKSLPDKQLSTY